MQTQQLLFDADHSAPPPMAGLPAHRDDPPTSFAAARKIMSDGTRAKQKLDVLRAVIRHGGRTSRELAELTELDRHMVARRLPDLAEHEFVMRGPARKCTRSSKSLLAVTWWATAEGMRLVQEGES